MRLKTVAAISILLFLATTTSVFAIESTTSAKKPGILPKVATPAIKERIETKIENKIETVNARIENIKEKIASNQARLKEKLAKFKDQKKAEIAEKISTNLNNINQNRTNEMTKNLEKMSVILNKLQSRITSGSPDIKDPSAAKAAVASTEAKIASTSSAVKAQAQKDYTVIVTTEPKIRTDVQKVRLQLGADLQAVRKMVVEAKQAVADAIRVAKSGKNEVKEGTSSGK